MVIKRRSVLLSAARLFDSWIAGAAFNENQVVSESGLHWPNHREYGPTECSPVKLLDHRPWLEDSERASVFGAGALTGLLGYFCKCIFNAHTHRDADAIQDLLFALHAALDTSLALDKNVRRLTADDAEYVPNALAATQIGGQVPA